MVSNSRPGGGSGDGREPCRPEAVVLADDGDYGLMDDVRSGDVTRPSA